MSAPRSPSHEPAPAGGAPCAQWFEDFFGFREGCGHEPGSKEAYSATQQRLRALCKGQGPDLRINGARVGEWHFRPLAELRQLAEEAAEASGCKGSPMRACNAGGDPTSSGDVAQWHRTPQCDGACFQVASQFNCLEMPDPDVVPEDGVTDYVDDMTQGPACALQCAASTAFRNYLVPVPARGGVPGGEGQTQERQLCGVAELIDELGGGFTITNGYISSTSEVLRAVNPVIKRDRQKLRGLVRVGYHFDAEVTSVAPPRHSVAQVFCSAVSLGEYAVPDDSDLWEPLARLVLEAQYESTLWVAVLYAARRRSAGLPVGPTFLTQLGGGVFGNRSEWIAEALKRAIRVLTDAGMGLDVRILHYDLGPGTAAEQLLERHYARLHRVPSGGQALGRDARKVLSEVRSVDAAAQAVMQLSERFGLGVVLPPRLRRSASPRGSPR
eukprot:TRINITY_DN71247_c0_g1_i1.p1 TRINITY_DN71247_c0_g1~~TRINITY_DN71247_c0_g1_i1.p1  ORF type:complete len:471 (+),score=103.99 TRINITY_DN71247_c0_g1_i1:93-1415(+)